MPAYPSGRLFSGKDLTPDFDVSLTSNAQPEKFDTTLPGNGGLNPTNAQFLAYLATLPSWSQAAVTTEAEFLAAAAAIDASGPAEGVIKFAATYDGTRLAPPNRPLPGGVQPDPTTCTIYCIPETLPSGFPEPAAVGAAFSTRFVKDALPVIRSAADTQGNGTPGVNGWHALDHFTGGMAQYGYRWIGFRFGCRSDGGETLYARVCGNANSRRIVMDRCHFDGVTDEFAGGLGLVQPQGFIPDGKYNASLDSWYDNFASASVEKQCILLLNGGPTKIVGNVLLCNGEPFIAGGQDPINPTVVDNYPHDLEFRRNFCRQNFGATEVHPAFYQLVTLGGNARTKRTGMTAAAYDAGTRTLTLSAGTFDTTLVSKSDDNARRRFWYVTSGAGAGSHGEVSTYNSTTSVTSADTTLTILTGAAIDATSVIEIRESIHWISKNCFELKCMRRAYIEGNVLENGWDMDGSQHFVVPLKSVNQGGTGTLSVTENITWVNSLILNCWGGIQVTAMPTPPCLAASKMHFENVLLVATPHLNFVGGDKTFNMPFTIGADSVSVRRSTAVNFKQASVAVWMSANVGDSGSGSEHKLLDSMFDGYVAGGSTQYQIDGIDMAGFQAGLDGYKANVDTASATWRVGIFDAATVNPTTDYPNTTDPGPAFTTTKTNTVSPFVNPLYDFTDPACDYSLTSAEAAILGTSMGVDWPTLQAAVANVRPATNVVPYQWIGDEVTSDPSTADHLALTTEPSASTVSGVAHAVQPAGTVEDASDATVTDDTSTITAAWVNESGSGVASGTLTAVAVAGVWTFTNLSVTSAAGCTGHWHFADGTLTGVDSATITITAASSTAIVAYMIYPLGA